MSTHQHIIGLFGGPAPLARLLNEGCYQRVYHWQRRGIPARHWPRLIELARSKGLDGVTLEALAQRHMPAEAAA